MQLSMLLPKATGPLDQRINVAVVLPAEFEMGATPGEAWIDSFVDIGHGPTDSHCWPEARHRFS